MKADINVIGVMPARYESTRLSRKLLRVFSGKTLLQWSWENASSAGVLDKLIIACDHPDVEAQAKEFGAEVVMTSVEHSSGTDRIAEAVRDIDVNIIVNIQADEPLIHPSVINGIVHEMLSNSSIVMATAKKKIEDKEEILNPNVVKVICDKSDYAVYFSRLPLPYVRKNNIFVEQEKVSKNNLPPACYQEKDKVNVQRNNGLSIDIDKGNYYKHLGVYAYTKDFLFIFKNLPKSYLENAESLEQLRAIESGYRIKVIETKFDSLGIDTESDLVKVEKIFAKRLEKN